MARCPVYGLGLWDVLFTEVHENNFLLSEHNQGVWLCIILNQQEIDDPGCELEAGVALL